MGIQGQSMGLRIYNTLSNSLEDFVPTESGRVKMYVCGPTVYNYLHIGNFRGPIFFNLVRNWMESLGYEVTYVYNYTDVDDKIIKRSREEGIEVSEISEKYIKAFAQDFERLQLRNHDHRPKVTDFIPSIVDFIAQLVEKGAAYEVEGQVFYAIKSFSSYGKLSGKKTDELLAGQRVEVDERKRDPGDFVLWKPAKQGAPGWDSPWGKGRPGWHIECSTMIQEILGETIDIHGGGVDLIFPHHENEIAQGEARSGKTYCKYWMHNNFINLDDEKMSKSLGNIILAKDFMDRYHPEILKYLVLSVHYRGLLTINKDKIRDAIGSLSRVYHSLEAAQRVGEGTEEKGAKGGLERPLAKVMEKADRKISKALNDDFNTGEVMAALFDVVRAFNSLAAKEKKSTAKAYGVWIRKYGQLMSLFNEGPSGLLDRFEDILLSFKRIERLQVENLVGKRRAARAARDWALADGIRQELSGMGIELMDGTQGREWKVILP